MPVLLSADRVVLPSGSVEPGWVETDGDRVAGAGGGTPPAPADRHLARHAGARLRRRALCTAAAARRSPPATRRGGHRARRPPGARHHHDDGQPGHRHHRAAGGSVRALAPLVRAGELAGIHLEGPWLSAEALRRARPGAAAGDPTRPRSTRLLEAGDGTVRMVTLAPELTGGLDAVRLLTAAGSSRRSATRDATYDVAREALDAGASVAHPPVQRDARGCTTASPDPAPRCSSTRDAYVELIADGVHLHPAVLRLAATREAAPLPARHRRDGRRRRRRRRLPARPDGGAGARRASRRLADTARSPVRR